MHQTPWSPERPLPPPVSLASRSEEHTSELQSPKDLVCRLLLEKKKNFFFFFNDTATTEIYTLSLHDALPILHQTPWSPERPLPPPVSLASQSPHEKPPEVTCTSRGKPGFPASTRERPRETFFTTSRGQIPLPGLESNDALPLATRMETRLPWRPTRGSLTSPSYLVRNRSLGPPLENHPETPPFSRR